jgi:hypothetical protein
MALPGRVPQPPGSERPRRRIVPGRRGPGPNRSVQRPHAGAGCCPTSVCLLCGVICEVAGGGSWCRNGFSRVYGAWRRRGVP